MIGDEIIIARVDARLDYECQLSAVASSTAIVLMIAG
jgi:hypothetical protein